MKVALVFVAFYGVEEGNELGWMQGAELLVMNVLFGLRQKFCE